MQKEREAERGIGKLNPMLLYDLFYRNEGVDILIAFYAKGEWRYS